MNQLEILPFPIGTTAGVSAATDKVEWEGKEYWVPDLDYSSSPSKPRAYGGGSGQDFKRVRIVRNVSGVALLPSLLVVFKAAKFGLQVDGYARVNPTRSYPVDEFLPTAGVANNDLFYITTFGNAGIKLSATAAEAAAIAEGDWITNVTAAASTNSTTAGRFLLIDTTGATTPLANQMLYAIGIALSAATTADTGAVRLCRVTARYF